MACRSSEIRRSDPLSRQTAANALPELNISQVPNLSNTKRIFVIDYKLFRWDN